MTRKTITFHLINSLCRTAEWRLFLQNPRNYKLNHSLSTAFCIMLGNKAMKRDGDIWTWLNEDTSMCFLKYPMFNVEKLHCRSCNQTNSDLWTLFSYFRTFSLDLRRVPSSSNIVLHHKKKSTTPDLSFVYTGKDTGISWKLLVIYKFIKIDLLFG